MPELPEIETIKLQLQRVLIGQRLVDVSLDKLKSLEGKAVREIRRRGKVLLINFGDNLDLGFHFKMTGQLIYDDGVKRVVGGHPTDDFVNKLPSIHTRVIFKFEKGVLYFNDQRAFGWIDINPKFVEKLGPEALEINDEEFVKRVQKFRRPIKVVLMDQEVLAGVGNIYANDALWEAGIDPRAVSNQLSGDQLRLILEKVKLVLREGIEYGGATADNYVNLYGVGGHYQEHFRVYARAGQKCKRCKSVIEKFVMGGRGTYMCPSCQK